MTSKKAVLKSEGKKECKHCSQVIPLEAEKCPNCNEYINPTKLRQLLEKAKSEERDRSIYIIDAIIDFLEELVLREERKLRKRRERRNNGK